MFFENGERVVTFQSKDSITNDEKTKIQEKFEKYKSEILYNLVITESTVNLLYNPILIMERKNTIEPSTVPLEALRDIVSEVKV